MDFVARSECFCCNLQRHLKHSGRRCRFCYVHCPNPAAWPDYNFQRCFFELLLATNHNRADFLEESGLDPVEYGDRSDYERAMRLLAEVQAFNAPTPWLQHPR